MISDAALAYNYILEEGKSVIVAFQRVHLKHLSIPQNTTNYNVENDFTDNSPDLVVIGLVADGDLCGHYNKNPFNFQSLGATRIKLKRNEMSVPRQSYTPNFADKRYNKDYFTFQEQLGFDMDDKCVCLTPMEWANGYTFFIFKVTDGPISSGIDAPRFKAAQGTIRLEITSTKAKIFL